MVVVVGDVSCRVLLLAVVCCDGPLRGGLAGGRVEDSTSSLGPSPAHAQPHQHKHININTHQESPHTTGTLHPMTRDHIEHTQTRRLVRNGSGTVVRTVYRIRRTAT